MSHSVYGVRHLSPAASIGLLAVLDSLDPEEVLVEGPEDASALIQHVAAPGSKPPLAIAAYTAVQPVRSILYPFAEYSPEYVALRWARERGARSAFIDLPSSAFLAMEDAPAPDAEAPFDPHSAIARAEGFDDYETWWEYRFERNHSPGAFAGACRELGIGLRGFDPGGRGGRDLLRERRMRANIARAVERAKDPSRILVVCGAFHAPALETLDDAMDDGELAKLPRIESKLALMPYSYYRLSSRSGYGASNRAPAYYGLLWKRALEGDPESSTDEFLSAVAKAMRDSGTPRATADVIEAVRLARTLAALRGGPAPSLADLRDAATATLGRGEFAACAEALARAEIGSEIGHVPAGAGRSPVQEDFYLQAKRLRLDKHLAAEASVLELDLRENRRVSGEEAAFLDLSRSFFLRRLEFLGVGFGQRKNSRQDSATWAEEWALRWSPEAEVALAESSLLGDTVEMACAHSLAERIAAAPGIAAAADLAACACACGLEGPLAAALARIDSAGARSSDFRDLAKAAWSLSLLLESGGLRRIDVEAGRPLLERLFLSAALSLDGASSCDPAAAKEALAAMRLMDALALERHKEVDARAWLDALSRLSARDDRAPLLSGYACSILLERGAIGSEELAAELSRRLSPGVPSDLGAGWFEGLAARNHVGLLSRLPLWERLAEYVSGLDDPGFLRAAVFLRRAFADFSPKEKRMICENLGELWKVGGDAAEDALRRELSEADKAALSGLNGMDFDDV